jgi:hypothetical protein
MLKKLHPSHSLHLYGLSRLGVGMRISMVMLGALMTTGPAWSSDADLQRVLLAAQCLNPKVMTLQTLPTKVLRISCSGHKPELITVTCAIKGCKLLKQADEGDE